MESIIKQINNSLINKSNINYVKSYFYNRNTIYKNLEYYLNNINKSYVQLIGNFVILNYNEVNIFVDCNNNKLIDCIFFINNGCSSYLINTNFIIENNKTNLNYIKIHNSENTNKLNQSINTNNIFNKSENGKYIPLNDYTTLENNYISLSNNGIQEKSVDYNKHIVLNNNIPNFYKSNFELRPENNHYNYLFEGKRSVKGGHIL